jgi:ribosomal protein S18 acetylase RimI-like enzyme
MEYKIVSDLTEQQILELYDLYQQEWWSNTRNLSDIRKMLQHTTLLVGICQPETNKLIGFSRIISDLTYKAMIFDVIIHDDYQGKGLGRFLVNHIVSHPQLESVEHIELYCKPDKVPFYEKLGFTKELEGLNFMRRDSSKE